RRDAHSGRTCAQSISRSISRWVRYRRLTVKFTMLGVRFLDVDFMRINSACACPTVYIIRIFCTVVKGGAAAWSASRSQCRMEAPGRVRGMRRGEEPGGQTHFVLPPNLYNEPPGRGDFLVSDFHPGLIPGNLVRNDFWR